MVPYKLVLIFKLHDYDITLAHKIIVNTINNCMAFVKNIYNHLQFTIYFEHSLNSACNAKAL